METKDTAIENNDTLSDSTQSDHTKELTTDPDEDPTTPMDEVLGKVATVNQDEEETKDLAEWKDTKSDKPASLTP